MSYNKDLLESLKKIFDLDKCQYDLPSDSREQEGLFVQVDRAVNEIKDQVQTARVYGKVHIFSQVDKMPWDYLAKQIYKAGRTMPAIQAKFYFFDLDENAGRYQNISERTFSFIYFYKGQFDPDRGQIDQITFTEVVT